jgi:type IV pilus assembly protein PilM
MARGSFALFPKTFVGVDIGTSFLKVVELSRWANRTSLKNYGELKSTTLYDKPFRTFEKSALTLSSQDIGKALRGILQETKIQSKKAVFSIPDFSSFFTHFELPPMSKEELPGAVEYEARRHIPLPYSQVTVDWQLTEGHYQEQSPFHILMVAVPNEVINQYQEIAQMANLELFALEAEVFGLIRACMNTDATPVVLVDMGAQSTTVSMVYKGKLRSSRSLDTGGNTFTERLAKSLSVEYAQAEAIKQKEGVESQERLGILAPLVDTIVQEIQKVSQDFTSHTNIPVQRVLLGGGSANLPGLQEYIRKSVQKETELVDPFRQIFYPPVLETTLQEMGPSYAVALGMALRGLE